MKVVTSKKFEKPVLENGLVKLTPLGGGTPEFIKICKFVDCERNEVWFCNGRTNRMERSNSTMR